MLTAELIKKIRKLEIRTNRVVDEVIGGAYHSVFKGRGIEFDEVREYTFEDDVRDIDWNVSARLGAPYVKKYVEERELNVMLLVDISGSTAFGRVGGTKRDLATESAAMLALSAIRNHDRVGLGLFTDRLELFLTPRSGRRHGLRLLRELVAHPAVSERTDIALALRESCNILTKRSVIFLISDLLDDSPELETALKIANRRHDVVILRVFDPGEMNLDFLRAAVTLVDAETGESVRMDAAASQLGRFAALNAARAADSRALALRSGVETVDLECGRDPLMDLVKFFRRREKNGRRRRK